MLPYLDDGVKTLDESVALMKRMIALGVERFTFTPHIAFPNMMNDKHSIYGALLIVRKHLEKEGVSVPMEAAAEYRMGEFMLELIERDDILATADKEVLVEHSFFAPSCYADDIICKLIEKGYQPVLAHPERYVYMDEKIERYIVDIVYATRTPDDYGLGKLSGLISYGASPRASISLSMASKAYAFIKRRGYVIPEDVRAVCNEVLRHRIGLTYEAEAENVSTENIISEIINAVEVP